MREFSSEVEVGADRFKREVWAYLSIDRAYGRPSANYQRIVEEGGREIGIAVGALEDFGIPPRALLAVEMKTFRDERGELGFLRGIPEAPYRLSRSRVERKARTNTKVLSREVCPLR